MCVSVLEIEFLTDNNPLAYRWIDISIKFDGRIFFLIGECIWEFHGQ